MKSWIFPLVFVPLAALAMYLFYRQGFVVTKSITAVFFWFQPGKDGDRAELNACSGWVRHMVRGSGTCEFSLDCQLSKGDAEVLFLNSRKQEILRLDRYMPSGQARLEEDGRYFLRWNFQHATGTCALRW